MTDPTNSLGKSSDVRMFGCASGHTPLGKVRMFGCSDVHPDTPPREKFGCSDVRMCIRTHPSAKVRMFGCSDVHPSTPPREKFGCSDVRIYSTQPDRDKDLTPAPCPHCAGCDQNWIRVATQESFYNFFKVYPCLEVIDFRTDPVTQYWNLMISAYAVFLDHF